MAEKKGKPKTPRNWGQNQAEYLAALEDQWVKVGFIDGKSIKGVLTGVDTYDVFVKPVGGPEVMVGKAGLKYIHPTASNGNDEDE